MADNQSLAEYLQRRDQFIPPGEVYGQVGRYAAPRITNPSGLPQHTMPYSGYLDPVMAMKKGFQPTNEQGAGYTLRTNDPLANLLAAVERATGSGNMGNNPELGTQLANYWSLPRAMRNPEPLPQYDPNNGILPGPRD